MQLNEKSLSTMIMCYVHSDAHSDMLFGLSNTQTLALHPLGGHKSSFHATVSDSFISALFQFLYF